MKHLLAALLTLLLFTFSFAQSPRIKPDKYPSLLWEIKGKHLSKPSYLFGTMHVSSKMAFNLSDSFYLALKAAQVVALETNPATWQEDFSRYDLEGESYRGAGRYRFSARDYAVPQDYLTINTLKFAAYEQLMEAALYSNPSILNNFLYRNRSEQSADFEEDTYLDLHIFQAGKKLGKKLCGVEDFHGSMQLVKEAYADAAKEKNKKQRSYDYDEEFSYRNMEQAYRTGNLDLLDTINKVNSQSAAFDEKFLYRRNEIQAAAIDSILKRGQSLFAGVGAAHLPGERGVIEWLRRAGYSLRPILMKQRDSHHKDAIEKLRMPVQFSRQSSADGFFSVALPGKLYSFGSGYGTDVQQFADMTNGSYYTVCRLFTAAALMGQTEAQVERKLDSVLYENIPGKILSKKSIVKNGYRGVEILNRTRRGDHQRYNIFVTPFEIIIFKMSGNGEYVKLGTEAMQFFSSIQLNAPVGTWKKYTRPSGGFEAELPHEPQLFRSGNLYHTAYDAASKTAFAVIRTDVHNHGFLEEDSFDLNLMEESFASSEMIQRQLKKQALTVGGYPALDVRYKCKDSSLALVRFLIDGPRYYTLVAKSETESKTAERFLQSFAIKPFAYGPTLPQTDTALSFAVTSPVALQKKGKLSMYPEADLYETDDDDDSLIDNGRYENRLIESDSTGEKVYVSVYRPSAYNDYQSKYSDEDSLAWAKEWTIRKKLVDTLNDGTVVTDLELGGKNSSRLLRTKSFERDGAGYVLQTQADTLSVPSAFLSSFFQSFSPVDSSRGADSVKGSALFFAQFFSADTLLHKTAVKNIGNVYVDSADFDKLRQAVASLDWREKKYLDVKKAFLNKLSFLPQKEATDYLKTLYAAAGDTVELQYAILESLLQQSTAYAFKTFANLLEADPPVLDGAAGNSSHYTGYGRQRYAGGGYDYEDDGYSNGSFLDNLSDSLELTAGIYKQLLPLMNLDDYETPLMELTATLLDSNRIAAKEYESFLPKLLIEAKQLLKKQVIREKTKAIEQAQQDEAEKEKARRYANDETDNGNRRLSLYASLLLPFWDKNPQVQPIINRMLASNDKRLKYNTAVQMLRAGRTLPDTLLLHLAKMDEYRYELYQDLKTLKKLSLFPAAYRNQQAIARSRLLDEQRYSKPDTVAFVNKLPLDYKGRSGWVYVFKYKESKEDNNWKLATVGLLPKDESLYSFDEEKSGADDDAEDAFTDLTNTKLTTDKSETEQLQTLLKKLLYSKRKSAVQFYAEEGRYGADYFRMGD